ncbi:MAG: hypothetical protein MK078_12305 [Crocinitomicaceae bacterium]|nr:hypothetical protein [Crocinitomicaceae bacterium]
MSEMKLFEDEHVRFENIDGIMRCTFLNGPITLEIAKTIVKERLKFFDGTSYPIIITDVGIKSIKSEARQFLSSDEALVGIKASAMVAKNMFAKHLANFFVKINVIKPKIPTQIFMNEDAAVQWLEQFKN